MADCPEHGGDEFFCRADHVTVRMPLTNARMVITVSEDDDA